MTIFVKPAPGLDPAAARLLRSDNGVGLLDASGAVPAAGMPWPGGGLTLTLLRDGVLLRADDPAFAEPATPTAGPAIPTPAASGAAAPGVAAEASAPAPAEAAPAK